MKTTIDLPEDLVREMKFRAVREGRRLREVAAEVFRRGLAAPETTSEPGARRRIQLPIIPTPAGAKPFELSGDRLLELAGTAIGVDFGLIAPTNFFNQVNTTSNGFIPAGGLIDTSNVAVDGVGFSWSADNPWFNNNGAACSPCCSAAGVERFLDVGWITSIRPP